MKNSSKTTERGIKVFNTIYIFGIIFVGIKMAGYIKWTFELIKEWSLPTTPFFSRVSLAGSNVTVSESTYLIFAIAYMAVFTFIMVGLYQLNQTVKLFSENKIFQKEVSTAFKNAGKSFLIYGFGTLIIDVAFLFWAQTSNQLVDLLSTELMVFIIMGYFMHFLSHVFQEGVILREENELTI